MVRFCQRVLPIEHICLAKIEDISPEATRLVQEHFANAEGPIDYCVAFESRLNESLDRMTVINMIAEIVGPRHKVNLSNPTKTIVVQVFKAHCGMAVLTDWVKNRKYNVQEVLKTVIESNKSSE
jgi:tRNA acetyltransferase TAN1